MKKFLLRTALLGSLGLLLAACGSSGGSTDSGEGASGDTSGGELRIRDRNTRSNLLYSCL